MRISRFDIENFKGIQSTTVYLAGDAPGNIITLIGLNESGKTTILEALASFGSEDTETASLVGTVHARSVQQDFIPKDKKAAFTGKITIKAFCHLDDYDLAGLVKYYKDNHNLEIGEVSRDITITRIYNFDESRFQNSTTTWGVNFPLKTNRAKKFALYYGFGDTRSTWSGGIDFLRSRLPKIVYFPTFLFKFPDRIYLEGGPESEVNPYYRKVMQDVLDSQGEGLSVARHIVDRIARVREGFPNPLTFFAHLMGLDEKSQIDAVLQKMSNEMSREIFGAWNQILGRDVSNKRVQVDWSLDADQGNVPYLQVSIIDGQSRYSLSERSLGFRWFFSFLLFTRFRRNRKDGAPTIFLFDEPASNLHSKAQMKLLESFPRIADGETYILYSTHSHYMVNPEWLEKSYIIDNAAINYEDEDEIDAFTIRNTDVKAVKYRTFVGSNPTKTTYFQPVLDALDVAFSPLLQQTHAVIIEGKFDYHPLQYFRSRAGASASPQLYPGNGAGNLECLVSLFRGWGVRFKILLDDDAAGKREKRRYLEGGIVASDEVFTLGEVVPSMAGLTFEGLYGSDVISAVSNHFSTTDPKKRQFALYFQELLAGQRNQRFANTEKTMKPLIEWLSTSFGSEDGPKLPKARSARSQQKRRP